MKPSVEVVEPKLFTGVVADEIVASVRDSISERGKCSLVLAGGSTPGAIYRLLARPPRVSEVEWDKVDLFWGDERWVPLDHTHSNYRMANETLLSQIPQPKPRIHAVPTNLADAHQGALEYAKTIREIEGSSPQFDIVLLGIGEDGHTASIFPHSSVIHDCPDLCAAIEHPQGGFRVTMSPQTIFGARKIIFIVKGDSKAETIFKVLGGAASVDELPARLYEPVAQKVTFFLDSGAAQRLAPAH